MRAFNTWRFFAQMLITDSILNLFAIFDLIKEQSKLKNRLLKKT